jgi:hypothetical protein
MSLFGKKVDPVKEVLGYKPGDRYEGPAAFSEGWYYPVKNDEHGNEVGPDRSMPLVWIKNEHEAGGGHLEHAFPESVNHFHAHGLNPVEIEQQVE